MRIHVHTAAPPSPSILTPARWDAAAARAPDVGAGHAVTYGTTTEELATALAEAEVLVLTLHKGVRPLPPAPHLRAVFVTWAGVDAILPLDWLPPGAVLLNNRGTHAEKAGEYGIMALLMLANHMPRLVGAQQAGRWKRIASTTLADRPVTVVGLGSLGGAVAEWAGRFGMRVTGVRSGHAPHPACERVVPAAELDAVLPGTEFLVLACPLTEATRGLLDRRRIALLPAGAGVVNIGRGPLLDQDALCDALEAERLGGAVLDVFTPEPVPPGHRLWTTPNLLMTPHVSSDDEVRYLDRSLDVLMTNLRAMRDGTALPNLVDAGRGY